MPPAPSNRPFAATERAVPLDCIVASSTPVCWAQQRHQAEFNNFRAEVSCPGHGRTQDFLGTPMRRTPLAGSLTGPLAGPARPKR